jgi:hypothetical protein
MEIVIFRYVFIAALLLSLPSQAPAQSVSSALPHSALREGKWEYLETKRKVALSRKLIGKKGLFAVRGETVVKAGVDTVAGVINDETRWNEWIELIEAKELRTHPDNRKTVYQAFNMPMMISNRDVVYTFGATRIGKTVFIAGRTESGKGHAKSVGVRMNLIGGDWTLTPLKNGHTKVVLEVLMDPKGYLPVWFVNIVQREYPLNTLSGLRRQVLKPGIRPLADSAYIK